MLTEDNPLVRVAELFLEQLFQKLAAAERIEIRDKTPDEHSPMRRNFFASVEEAAKYAASVGTTRDVYVGVAPRRGEVGTKSGVCRTYALWADLDAKAGYTRESRLHQLMGLPYHPSMLVWSGGGWHPYWLLQTPAESPEDLKRAEHIMQRLAEGLNGDPVHDRSRILRVPGTYNHKYGEPRFVQLERCNPGLRYELDRLQEMAKSLPKQGEGSSVHSGKACRDVLSGPIRKSKRNVALASVAGSLRDRGLDKETIHVVLLEVNRLRCEPPLAETEVLGIVRSVGKYPAGSPRYRRSSTKRIYRNREGR